MIKMCKVTGDFSKVSLLLIVQVLLIRNGVAHERYRVSHLDTPRWCQCQQWNFKPLLDYAVTASHCHSCVSHGARSSMWAESLWRNQPLFHFHFYTLQFLVVFTRSPSTEPQGCFRRVKTRSIIFDPFSAMIFKIGPFPH